MYVKVFILDHLGCWGLYHITKGERAEIMREMLLKHPDIYGVKIEPCKE